MTMITNNFLLLIGLLAIINGMAFFMYARDKVHSQNNGWRTPENLLLVTAAAGPFGAYAAMRLLRHKTRKTKFLLVPVFLVIQVILIFRLVTIQP